MEREEVVEATDLPGAARFLGVTEDWYQARFREGAVPGRRLSPRVARVLLDDLRKYARGEWQPQASNGNEHYREDRERLAKAVAVKRAPHGAGQVHGERVECPAGLTFRPGGTWGA